MVRSELVLIAALVLESGPSAAQSMAPLPPPRPSDVPSPAPPPPVRPEPPQKAPSEEASLQTAVEPDPCLTKLKAAGFDLEVAEQPSTTNELCRIDVPVRLNAVPAGHRGAA